MGLTDSNPRQVDGVASQHSDDTTAEIFSVLKAKGYVHDATFPETEHAILIKKGKNNPQFRVETIQGCMHVERSLATAQDTKDLVECVLGAMRGTRSNRSN